MDHGEVVRLQLRVPPGLSSVEVLRLPEVRQVAMIRPDLELVLCAEEVRSPLLESIHDRCGEERDMNFINYLDCLCKYKTTQLRSPSAPQPSIYSIPSWSVHGQGPASGTDP